MHDFNTGGLSEKELVNVVKFELFKPVLTHLHDLLSQTAHKRPYFCSLPVYLEPPGCEVLINFGFSLLVCSQSLVVHQNFDFFSVRIVHYFDLPHFRALAAAKNHSECILAF